MIMWEKSVYTFAYFLDHVCMWFFSETDFDRCPCLISLPRSLYINEGVWLCPCTTLFIKTGSGKIWPILILDSIQAWTPFGALLEVPATVPALVWTFLWLRYLSSSHFCYPEWWRDQGWQHVLSHHLPGFPLPLHYGLSPHPLVPQVLLHSLSLSILFPRPVGLFPLFLLSWWALILT